MGNDIRDLPLSGKGAVAPNGGSDIQSHFECGLQSLSVESTDKITAKITEQINKILMSKRIEAEQNQTAQTQDHETKSEDDEETKSETSSIGPPSRSDSTDSDSSVDYSDSSNNIFGGETKLSVKE